MSVEPTRVIAGAGPAPGETADPWKRAMGRGIRRRRRDLGLTQSALAARMGGDRAWLSRLEAGRGNATMDTMAALAAALGCALAGLFVAGADGDREADGDGPTVVKTGAEGLAVSRAELASGLLDLTAGAPWPFDRAGTIAFLANRLAMVTVLDGLTVWSTRGSCRPLTACEFAVGLERGLPEGLPASVHAAALLADAGRCAFSAAEPSAPSALVSARLRARAARCLGVTPGWFEHQALGAVRQAAEAHAAAARGGVAIRSGPPLAPAGVAWLSRPRPASCAAIEFRRRLREVVGILAGQTDARYLRAPPGRLAHGLVPGVPHVERGRDGPCSDVRLWSMTD